MKNSFQKNKPSFRCIVIIGMLIVTILIVYGQTLNFGFVDYDDDKYIIKNKYIQTELSLKSLQWAFTAFYEASWQPVVWISYLIEYQLHGLNPGWQHLANVFFHIANALLLFFVFIQMTSNIYRSAFVAFLFALHPIHVESVVWITERKDVLCAFFWMLTILSYIRYVKQPSLTRYIPILIFLSLGLMAKPMPVTLPFTLLLLDLWPLGRINLNNLKPNFPLLFEKLPLFIPIIISIMITILTSKTGGAVAPIDIFPISLRIENAIFSYLSYLGKMIWPFTLSAFYPHPVAFSGWTMIGSTLIIATFCIFAIKKISTLPWFFVGWFWFLGTLIPVIGIVKIGGFAMADRFAYIPFIGIYVVLAWGVPLFLSDLRSKKGVLLPLCICFFVTMMFIAWNQVHYWQNTGSLFRHAINVTPDNAFAHNSLGDALKKNGDLSNSFTHYLKALQIDPSFYLAHNNIGMIFADSGNIDKALNHYSIALQINPDFAAAHNNIGIIYYQNDRFQKALKHFKKALKSEPDNIEIEHNLNIVLKTEKKIYAAIERIKHDLVNNPDSAILYYQLGNMYQRLGEDNIAIKQYQKALSVQNDFSEAETALKNIQASQKTRVWAERFF